MQVFQANTTDEKSIGVSQILEKDFVNSMMIFNDIYPASNFHMKTVGYPIGIMSIDQDGKIIDKEKMAPLTGTYKTPAKTVRVVEIGMGLWDQYEVGDDLEMHREMKREGQFLTDKENIKMWLDNAPVDNYRIDDVGFHAFAVDVEGDVILRAHDIIGGKLPVQLRTVTGQFDCAGCGMISLKGSPLNVGGDFYCHRNNLQSLLGGPHTVGGDYNCSDNELINLKGIARSIGGEIKIAENSKLTSVEGLLSENYDKIRDVNIEELGGTRVEPIDYDLGDIGERFGQYRDQDRHVRTIELYSNSSYEAIVRALRNPNSTEIAVYYAKSELKNRGLSLQDIESLSPVPAKVDPIDYDLGDVAERFGKRKGQLLQTRDEVEAWLIENGISNYSFVSDDPERPWYTLVNVRGNVDLSGKQMDRIPVHFNFVTGYFYCDRCGLQEFEYVIDTIGESFECSSNQIKSLAHGPRSVGAGYYCEDNDLESLVGVPKVIKGNFSCASNGLLKTLKGGPEKVAGGYDATNCELKNLEGIGEAANEITVSGNPLEYIGEVPAGTVGNISYLPPGLPPDRPNLPPIDYDLGDIGERFGQLDVESSMSADELISQVSAEETIDKVDAAARELAKRGRMVTLLRAFPGDKASTTLSIMNNIVESERDDTYAVKKMMQYAVNHPAFLPNFFAAYEARIKKYPEFRNEISVWSFLLFADDPNVGEAAKRIIREIGPVVHPSSLDESHRKKFEEILAEPVQPVEPIDYDLGDIGSRFGQYDGPVNHENALRYYEGTTSRFLIDLAEDEAEDINRRWYAANELVARIEEAEARGHDVADEWIRYKEYKKKIEDKMKGSKEPVGHIEPVELIDYDLDDVAKRFGQYDELTRPQQLNLLGSDSRQLIEAIADYQRMPQYRIAAIDELVERKEYRLMADVMPVSNVNDNVKMMQNIVKGRNLDAIQMLMNKFERFSTQLISYTIVEILDMVKSGWLNVRELDLTPLDGEFERSTEKMVNKLKELAGAVDIVDYDLGDISERFGKRVKRARLEQEQFNRFVIEMTLEQAQSCSHPGPCDADVDVLRENPDVQKQFEDIDPDDIRVELRDYGAWSDEELEDDEENQVRILWIAAGNIVENEIEEEEEEIDPIDYDLGDIGSRFGQLNELSLSDQQEIKQANNRVLVDRARGAYGTTFEYSNAALDELFDRKEYGWIIEYLMRFSRENYMRALNLILDGKDKEVIQSLLNKHGKIGSEIGSRIFKKLVNLFVSRQLNIEDFNIPFMNEDYDSLPSYGKHMFDMLKKSGERYEPVDYDLGDVAERFGQLRLTLEDIEGEPDNSPKRFMYTVTDEAATFNTRAFAVIGLRDLGLFDEMMDVFPTGHNNVDRRIIYHYIDSNNPDSEKIKTLFDYIDNSDRRDFFLADALIAYNERIHNYPQYTNDIEPSRFIKYMGMGYDAPVRARSTNIVNALSHKWTEEDRKQLREYGLLANPIDYDLGDIGTRFGQATDEDFEKVERLLLDLTEDVDDRRTFLKEVAWQKGWEYPMKHYFPMDNLRLNRDILVGNIISRKDYASLANQVYVTDHPKMMTIFLRTLYDYFKSHAEDIEKVEPAWLGMYLNHYSEMVKKDARRFKNQLWPEEEKVEPIDYDLGDIGERFGQMQYLTVPQQNNIYDSNSEALVGIIKDMSSPDIYRAAAIDELVERKEYQKMVESIPTGAITDSIRMIQLIVKSKETPVIQMLINKFDEFPSSLMAHVLAEIILYVEGNFLNARDLDLSPADRNYDRMSPRSKKRVNRLKEFDRDPIDYDLGDIGERFGTKRQGIWGESTQRLIKILVEGKPVASMLMREYYGEDNIPEAPHIIEELHNRGYDDEEIGELKDIVRKKLERDREKIDPVDYDLGDISERFGKRVAQVEYHGGPSVMEGGILDRHKKSGWDAGGIFTTPSLEFAEEFAAMHPGGKVWEIDLSGKKILDLTEPSGNQLVKKQIGSTYKDEDGEELEFSQVDFDYLFPSNVADWATFGNYVGLFEKMGYDGARIFENTAYGIKSTALWRGGLAATERVRQAQSKEMVDWFESRTRNHVDLVKKYAKKIAGGDKAFVKLLDQVKDHDADKFEEPLKTPYVNIAWKYKCEDDDKEFKPSDDDKDKMDEATGTHVVDNKHHPEYYSQSKDDLINKEDRDGMPDKIVDATKMEDLSVAEMVADWCAMSEEKGNTPFEWAEKTVGKRWKFTDAQEELIYRLMDIAWDKKQEKQLPDETAPKVAAASSGYNMESIHDSGNSGGITMGNNGSSVRSANVWWRKFQGKSKKVEGSMKRSAMEEEELQDLYKLNYFFDMVRLRPWTGMEKRYDNTLKRLESEGKDVADSVIESLLSVFNKWLASHAITEPKAWAEARVRDSYEMFGEDEEEYVLNDMAAEYKRYGGAGSFEDAYTFIPEMIRELNDPNIWDEIYLSELRNDLISSEESDKEYYEEQGDEEGAADRQQRTDELEGDGWKEYVIGYLEEDSESFINALNVPYFVEQVYEKLVFPNWYAHWRAQDLDKIRADNEEMVNELTTAEASDTLSEKFVAVNKALNAVHVTGAMMDYVEEMWPEINQDLLNELSNKDTSEWDAELQKMGVDMSDIINARKSVLLSTRSVA